MLIVALTGNIASGKSSVARRLSSHGALVIDADQLAREAVAPGSPGLDAIAQRWGDSMRNADGSLDRAALRRIVFADATEREALNAIVHPLVEALRRERIEAARREGRRIVICDIPLLFETGLDREFACIVLVDAPDAVRLERLVVRRGLGYAEARQMMAAQLPAAMKRERADYIIENHGSFERLHADVDALWRKLEQQAVTAR